jgi:hypothetical protein
MKFNSQICTSREQSERLLALGLKKVTADCVVSSIGSKDRLIHTEEPIYVMESLTSKRIPNYLAWSLHRLLCLFPQEYIYDIDFQQVMQDFVFRSQDMYDEVISCIETLIEAGYFYEEYLEE